jgi:hypothetical protein
MKRTLTLTLKIALGLLALLLTLGNNCITSGNVIVVTELGDLNAQTNTDFRGVHVNLTTNSDWQDHKAQLNSVDDIGFACKITNHESSVATGQIWISEKSYGTPDSVNALATKILDGIAVPANSTVEIQWKDSYNYLSNFNQAKTIVYKENFYLYFKVQQTPFDIDVKDIVLILSLNGKP